MNSLSSLLMVSVSNFNEIEIQGKLRSSFVSLLNRIKDDRDIASYFTELGDFAVEQIDMLPTLFAAINLKIRPVENRYHSCIITDEEVDTSAQTMHTNWLLLLDKGQKLCKIDDLLNPFELLPKPVQRLYREIFYCFPIALKAVGYEVVKPSELNYFNAETSETIARVLHERYRHLMRDKDKEQELQEAYRASYLMDVKYYDDDFDKLPVNIQNANFDSAYHIPTKLLSIGYVMERVRGDIEPNLLFLDEADIETMAKLEHERWCWEKRLSGFVYGPVKTQTTHHCLVPYNELSEYEKSKDRDQVMLYPQIIRDLDFTVKPVSLSPEHDISYVYRKPSKIENSILILEKQNLNISQLLKSEDNSFGELPEMLKNMGRQLEIALSGFNQVRDSIRQSEHVQQNILPSRISFRMCFPDSFLLFKPLDIVSGDFYFVAQLNEQRIIAIADCTGHGISAAMLTMVCCNYLDFAINVNRLSDPAEILRFLFPKLEDFLSRQHGGKGNGAEMDISICSIHQKTGTLRYVSINQPILLLQNGVVEKLNPTRCMGSKLPIVSTHDFISNEIQLPKGSMFYMFSDGIVDQFGGEKDGAKRFGIKRLSSLLSDNSKFPMLLQREKINETLENWRKSAEEPQTDDVIIAGIRV